MGGYSLVNYEYFGPDRLELTTKGVILNSRQSKYPVGNDQWIKNTVRAAEYIGQAGHTLLASLGMNSWEIPLALASINKIPVIVVLWYRPCDAMLFIAEICRRFNLDADAVGIIVPEFDSSRLDRKFWPERDRLAVDLADLVFPVSIRAGGRLDKLIATSQPKVDDRFQTLYDQSRRKRPQYEIRSIYPELVSGNWLVHFTRSNNSAWPGQTETEYYRSVIASGDKYCHSALDALNNITGNSILYGSCKNLKNGFRAIGFTDIGKVDLSKLFRYRPRLVNPGFEPYGIALNKNYAESIGIRPVIYGDEKLYRTLAECDRPFYQNSGRNSHHWESESEWRLAGDLNLDLIPEGALAQVVPDRSYLDKTENQVQGRGAVPVWPLAIE